MSLLPPNATNLERALAAAVQLPALPSTMRDLWNPDLCPEALLPWLAWSLSIDNWNPAWSVAIRRERIRQAIALQRIKGTRQSVADAIAVLGGEVVDIVEWFDRDPAGTPRTFCLVLDLEDDEGSPPAPSYLLSILREASRTKPVGAHFTVTQKQKATAGIAFAAAARPTAYTRLSFEVPEDA
ncbi:phage tail protein I [Asticcacaulis biprosthecium C19]|uniref:Phage tail protein I n=1 Tax=Asticcacaulis biprosthecium C19 TaxID=715226 RepID=F4QJC1_9CAUL|nr:phage tail protein I [Asticcacaulis biprosthecium]EGF93104.1 phage tail protein I [Asticcacaulis biprosthecium C19]